MPELCLDQIYIDTDGSINGCEFLSVIRARSQSPSRSFSLTSCVPIPEHLSSDPCRPDGWCHWELVNWGAMWDMSFRTKEPYVDCNGNGITIIGETPWTPPAVAFDRLAAAFPSISIRLIWEVPDMRGGIIWKGAARIHEWERSTVDDIY